MTNLSAGLEPKQYYPFDKTDLYVWHTHTLYTMPPTRRMLIGQVLDDHRIRHDDVAGWFLRNHHAQVILIWSPNCGKPYSLFMVPWCPLIISANALWKYIITRVACLHAAYNKAFYNCRLCCFHILPTFD